MPTSQEIESVVIEAVRMLAEDFELEALNAPNADSRIYGEGGNLDSMALVNLIADLEEAVAEKFGASITLADERAMSAHRSPFLTIASLCDAVAERIAE